MQLEKSYPNNKVITSSNQSLKWNQKKLWDLWLETISNYNKTQLMVTLSGRLQVQAMVKPQEPWIFQKTSKAKPTTNIIVLKDLRLWL